MAEDSKPTVLIVGAGIGGLLLGALLERASIRYSIFERAVSVKPLGNEYRSWSVHVHARHCVNIGASLT